MQITSLEIDNFRSIKHLKINLEQTTVFIGPNNAGKTSILEAIRIGLSRRWGQKGTGFTENDIHLDNEESDPRTAPPVKITFNFTEPSSGAWSSDMVAELEEIMALTTNGLNTISVSVTYPWNEEKQIFDPTWEFLNSSGDPLPPRRRSVNLLGFYDHVFFLWLGALRDIDTEFAARSRNWGGLLKSIKIPASLEKTIKETLDALDAQLLQADPKFAQIAETIGKATEVTVQNSPGAAKLRMLPLNVWDMLARAGIVLRNEDLRPWLPLGHHGQGLQSLSIIFLFQAAAALQFSGELHEGTEPIFAIEEPEAHLHPQAARALWERIFNLPGQKLVTTHSPYFLQNVPLHNIKLVQFRDGCTDITALSTKIESDLPWTSEVENLISGKGLVFLTKNTESGNIDSTSSFEQDVADDLVRRLSGTSNTTTDIQKKMDSFRRSCRTLISKEEEEELSFFGRRIRGEIFFSYKWIMVEGPCEYLLLYALGEAFSYPLDQHGITVIDFKNCGNASIYPALADAFNIPWRMITDGDSESSKFMRELIKRGFNNQDLTDHFRTLPAPNNLEDQLLADGHEVLLKEIMVETGDHHASKYSVQELKKALNANKTQYMSRLAARVAKDPALALKMPEPFVSIINDLKSSNWL